jgi:hypothetical protein
MSAQAGSPISTYFRVCDGVRVRFADTRAEADGDASEPRHPVAEPLGHHTGMGTGELCV